MKEEEGKSVGVGPGRQRPSLSTQSHGGTAPLLGLRADYRAARLALGGGKEDTYHYSHRVGHRIKNLTGN